MITYTCLCGSDCVCCPFCGDSGGTGKFSASLKWLRSELVYDIRNYAYVEGDVMEEQPTVHSPHQVQDVGEEGNIDIVTRILNRAHREATEFLYPYSKDIITEDVEDVWDDMLKEQEQYGMTLCLPSKFSMTTVKLLGHLIHDFMVFTVLYEWLGITNPGAEKKWWERLEETKRKIKDALSNRGGRTHRPMRPW